MEKSLMICNKQRNKKSIWFYFISQHIAEIIPEAVSTQKGTLYDIYSNFKCTGNIIHININYFEGTYNVGDVLNCITEKGEVNYTTIEKYYNTIIVDRVIDGCVVVWLCGCVVVWLCGCVVVWLCGCVVVKYL